MRDERLIKALTWGLYSLLGLALVVTVVLAACTPTRPEITRTGTARPDCDRAKIITGSMVKLGEAQTTFRLISPAEMTRKSGSANYGLASPDHVDFLSTMECRYVAATVAHELIHVWQFRSGDSDYTDEDEIVADCGSVLTGWEDYYPYLTKRGYGCTPDELRAAQALRAWAR